MESTHVLIMKYMYIPMTICGHEIWLSSSQYCICYSTDIRSICYFHSVLMSVLGTVPILHTLSTVIAPLQKSLICFINHSCFREVVHVRVHQCILSLLLGELTLLFGEAVYPNGWWGDWTYNLLHNTTLNTSSLMLKWLDHLIINSLSRQYVPDRHLVQVTMLVIQAWISPLNYSAPNHKSKPTFICDTFTLKMGHHQELKTHWLEPESHLLTRTYFLLESATYTHTWSIFVLPIIHIVIGLNTLPVFPTFT